MTTPTEILFVRQRHDAKRSGLHNDYRVVIGDKAFSWASKKEFPEIGKPTILWEQPIHHARYLDNPSIVIPEGQYGAGTQVIDYAQKGKAIVANDAYHLELNNGDRFLIKKAPESYGEKAWLFLRKKTLEQKNAYLEKAASLGTKDMDQARRQINEHRVGQGKSEIGHEDFEEQFKDRRGSGHRWVASLGIGMVAPLVGHVGGYYLGKSMDNETARKNMVLEHLQKSASSKERDNQHGWRRTGTVLGTTTAARLIGAPVNLGLVKLMTND